MKRYLYYMCLLCILLSGCQRNRPSHTLKSRIPQPITQKAKQPQPAKNRTARMLDSLGFINLAEADSTIIIRLMYARPDNFTGRVLYKDLREAYLHPKAAHALLRAQRYLRSEHPQYRLIVYDAARPMHIQSEMWRVVRGTSKNIYVSNPAHGGGLHNYGLAVDISIVGADGQPLDMGTSVDHMGVSSHITAEGSLVRQGIISSEALHNRHILRKAMRKAGFRPLPTEWWHFNYCSRKVARKYYHVIP